MQVFMTTLIVLLSIAIVALGITVLRNRKELRACREIADLELTKNNLTITIETNEQRSTELKDRVEELEGVAASAELKHQLEVRQAELRERVQELEGVIDLHASRERLEAEKVSLSAEAETLKSKIVSLQDELEMESYGLYRPIYDFGSSVQYKERLAQTRNAQKQMVKDKTAVIADVEWKIGGSATEGRKMMREQTRLMLRAFNGEADAIIGKVTHKNFEQIRKRLEKSFDAINKLGKSKQMTIQAAYLALKIDELHLVHEYALKKEAEREEQRLIREQIREEQRVAKEIEKAKKAAEREERQYEQALARARKEAQSASAEKQGALSAEIERLNILLAEAHEKRERAIAQAQLTRTGHVYVISNIGSFGKDVYKIGMTRRLEPMDRVKELGDASVPFSFDVHAMIHSDDAPSLERTLHSAFADRRLNCVNLRKEFFNVSLDEIHQVAVENCGEVEFTMMADADEYRQSRSVWEENKLPLLARNGA